MSNQVEINYQTLGENEQASFTHRESQTAEQLKIIDPQLGGLYEQALKLVPKIHQEGVAYLVAHAGREISRGLTRRLLSEEEIYLPPELDDEEKYRPIIAGILQLPTTDPRVDIWSQLHRGFVSWSHYRDGVPPQPEEVREAFEQLSSILFGRIGPYFETQAQLDKFLETPYPSSAEVKLLQNHLLRPAQRQYFFAKLQNPLWVKPLNDAGVFSNPPDLMPTADPNRLQIRSWPEGIYLARVANHVPTLAVSIFSRIPKTLKNPSVWSAVADAASQLDLKFSSQLVGKLKHALESGSTDFFADKVVKVAASLALAGKKESFELSDHLMWIPPVTAKVKDATAIYNTDWMFPRFAYLGLRSFFNEVLPALENIDAERLLKMLLLKIDRINRFSDPQEYGLGIWRRVGETDWRRENIPARLFLATSDIAIRLARTDRASATHVLELLKERSGKIFRKLQLKVLADAGEHLQDKIDDFITSDDAMNPPYSFREIPEIVRKQFQNASPLAKRIFRYGLERGPDMTQVVSEFQVDEIEQPDESQLIAIKNRWVRRRLTWFRGEIPEELKPLAKEVGLDKTPPTFEEQELAEAGYYVGGGVSWNAEPPLEAEDLSTRSIEEIFESLKSFSSSNVDELNATKTKLERGLLQYCTNVPDKALEIAKLVTKEQVAAPFIDTLLVGVRQAAEANNRIDWNEALQFADWAIQFACGDHVSRFGPQIASAAVALTRAGAENDRAPQMVRASMWRIMYAATNYERLWEGSNEQQFTTFEAVVSAALNERSGWFVQALILVALWSHRGDLAANEHGDRHSVDGSKSTGEELIPILESILKKEGREGIAAQAMLGHYIPQIHYLVPEWVMAHSEELFAPEDPLKRPIWAAYITRARMYPAVFEALRPWYLVAARVASTASGRISESEREWSTTRSLIVKVTIEMVRGHVSIGDADHLLETVFANVPSSDKSLINGKIETKQQARQLINRLGEKGYGQFGELLTNAQ